MRSSLVLIAAVAAACGNAQPPSGDALSGDTAAAARADEAIPEGFRVQGAQAGRIVQAESGLRFEACGDPSTSRAVRDADGRINRLIEELGTDGVLTVLARLDGEQVTEIRHASPGQLDCDRLPPDGTLEARGNEPFWMIAIEDGAATFRTPELPDGVRYTGGQWTRGDTLGWRYEAELASAAIQGASADSASAARSPTRIRLDLVETECRDSMSGALFPFRATLTRHGETFQGCALEGRSAM